MRLACLSLPLIASLLVACGEPPDPSTDASVPADAGSDPSLVEIRFDPDATDFYRMPWPSDARLRADGTPDLSDFPARRRFLDSTLAEIERTVHGFATMPVAYFALSQPVTEDALPVDLEALSPTSPIQMMDLSPDGCGERVPLEIALSGEGDAIRPANILQIANAVGRVLTPGRPYGVLILRTFGAEDGRSTPRPAAFDAALNDSGGGDALARSLGPLRDCLPNTDVSLDDVAVATVFTPQDPVAELATLHDFVTSDALTTRDVIRWRVSEGWSRRRLGLQTWVAHVEMPVFQEGETPYLEEGGALVFDEAGTPVVQRWEEAEIAVAMRTIDPPPEGPRPVLVFEDGTGWAPWNHLTDNWISEALDQGYVVMSFMPQFHGGRAGFDGNTEVSTFNLPNPPAARTNFTQQSAEVSWFLRMIRERIVTLDGLPELDVDHVVYGGHSQGALVGALTAAVEDGFDGYVFNGLSAYLTQTVLFRKDLLDFEAVVKLLFSFMGDLDRFHPLLQIMQLGAEVVDPHNFVARWHGWSGLPDGNHVYVVNGLMDDTTTPRGMEHMTMSARMPPIAPPGWDVDPVGVWDVAPVTLPVMGNVTSFGGTPVTNATFLDASQGHGTIYRNAAARDLAHVFWRTARMGTPELYETIERVCGDGADGDRDGMTDCDDPDCAAIPPCVEGVCDDGMDDDGNGQTDCADPACAGNRACREAMCGDGTDDDGDGDTDCDDADCARSEPCVETSCGDRVDGDMDGATDCDDSDCASFRRCFESSCTNMTDDDGDGMIDCDDPECRGNLLCPERMCGDSMDDDGNGLTDCADLACASAMACVPTGETMCGNGTDDDGDGAADCADADCALFAACAASTCAHGTLGRQTGVGLFRGTLVGRANDYPPGDCTPLGGGDETPDIALEWTPPAAGTYVISTYGSAIDTILSVLGPSCDPVNELACDDDESPAATSRLEITLEADQTVVIVVNAYSAEEEGDVGPIVLHVLPAP